MKTSHTPHGPDEPCCGACEASGQGAQGQKLVRDRGAPLRLSPGQTVELQVIGAPATRFVLRKPESTLGRGKSADIVLDTNKLAREQCVFKVSDTVTVEDLGSGCGTFVNGEKIIKTSLHENDVLWLADFRFRLVVK